ncbi:MAG: Ig-like domain-containing protein [Chloroherpetonaceae bacterium]|nr:Ig-like domain-containing protein [Chloroherpetonaceae bacterium]
MKLHICLKCISYHTFWPIVLLFASCATEVAPQGGPEDRTPPKIVKIYPDSGTTRFSGNRIVIEFNKFVNMQSLRAAVFFSPALEDIEIRGSGLEAEILIYDTLKPNRTYTYTLTSDLRDTRGNALEKSYTFAFSTGDRIDSGTIAGRVFGQNNRPLKGALVLAYFLPEHDSLYADTLNPATQKPDYLAQTDSAGNFQLNYLAEGRYRLIAIEDKVPNRRYDFAEEPFAVPFHPVRTGMQNVLMRMTSEPDTAKLELQVAEARSVTTLALRFNRNLALDSLLPTQFIVFDSTAKSLITVYDFYALVEGGREHLMLVTDSLRERHLYGIRAVGVKDQFGISGDSLLAACNGSEKPDTTIALWQPPFADSTQNVLEKFTPSARGRTLLLQFSAPINRASLQAALTLEQQIAGVFQPVPYRLFFVDAKRAELQPEVGFALGAWYRLTIDHSRLFSARNLPTKDTVISRRFQIASEEQFGTLEGNLICDSAGTVLLQAELLGENRFYPTLLRVQPDATGVAVVPFTLSELPEGRYFLSAFYLRQPHASPYDKWNGGAPYPFRYADRFALGFNSVRVRKRWTTTGARLRFPTMAPVVGRVP